MSKIRVLCVDDSALMRQILTEMINSQPDMEVIATAPDPLVARDLIKQLDPDVLTLDVEMPKMDGLDFLARIMRLRPMPVVMVSTLTQKGSDITLKALELGAIDFVTKPQIGIRDKMLSYTELLADKIRIAAKAKISKTKVQQTTPSVLKFQSTGSVNTVIAIGASTGGTEAIREVLERMPNSVPPIVITQHMPAGFTYSFAERLNKICTIQVKEAEHGDMLQKGLALIAPGDKHLEIKRVGAGFQAVLNDGPNVNRHKPSVDVLFNSVAQQVGKNAVGALLTGMGADGAKGLLEMKNKGAWTIAQNEASCVVFGMPREAIVLDAASEVLDIKDITKHILAKAGRF
ncbi:protein-glutamate methylesterase/protein-glutamine glutaminase [Thorsellia anophelis]|uniref:Protein-glutamate methylesterase/protein-glutamine glutaminase n=1 Tax=Thorsellia anophelis DSM 18579 TaxID=1123402 RepID=A0A1I0BXE4_9GAMM|nr:chemotaxis response regulator protein-glutamate methylesterase [Thorsellia anophelis]SET11664.1 two-component system, chemotaxis family, response regulator CheB [Thorsellia anophelis DSM 18579]